MHCYSGSILRHFKTMKSLLTLLLFLPVSALIGQITIISAWDFNSESIVEDDDGPFTLTANSGGQSGTSEMSVVVGSTGSGSLEIQAEGTTMNDSWNSPAIAGNSLDFLHGGRNDGTTSTLTFDASSISTDISLSFAFNQVDPDGVDTYQASYSTDGGNNFTNVGSAVTIADQGVWSTETIDFGTSLSGVSDAMVRITLDNGGATWNEEHQSNMDNVALTTVVPEPSHYAIALSGIVLAAVFIRRRRQG